VGIFTKAPIVDDDPLAKRVLWALIILFFELVIVAGLIPRSFTEKQITRELDMITKVMGKEEAILTQSRGKDWFTRYFVDTGAYDASFKFFIPTEAERRKSKGLEDFGKDNIFPFMEKVLISVWTGALQACIRIAHYMLWWPFFIMAAVPAILDAILERKRKQASFEHASAIRYRYAINFFSLLIFLFTMSVFFPIAIPPLAVPVGFVLGALCLSVIVANLQKKI
jgi:hypothetical protein